VPAGSPSKAQCAHYIVREPDANVSGSQKKKCKTMVDLAGWLQKALAGDDITDSN
jgi:hypothetical protein